MRHRTGRDRAVTSCDRANRVWEEDQRPWLRLRRKSSVNVEYIIISLIKELSNPELDSAFTSASEYPGLCWMEFAVHSSEARGLVGWMGFQDLYRDY
jgi:hypothetical protein